MKGSFTEARRRILALVPQIDPAKPDAVQREMFVEQAAWMWALVDFVRTQCTDLTVEKVRFLEGDAALWIARYTARGNAVSRNGPAMPDPLAALVGLAMQAIA